MLAADKSLVLIHESRSSRIYYQAASPYGRPVIIKVAATDPLTPKQLIRLKNEYEFTKNLSIDGVRQTFALTKLEDKPALVMEYIAGQTLRQAFVERKQSLIDFLQVAARIAETLAEVHKQHIIHKNIHSGNILVDPETKQIKVIDFGLASRLDSMTKYLGNPEKLPGTLAYISPEQTGRMNRVVDYRTDLYSLGVSFYEMLTGRLPFESDDPLALVHAHMAKAPQPVSVLNPDVPPLVSDIILKLLAKNAEDRYQSAYGLKADLEKCLACLQDPRIFADPAGLDFRVGQEDHSGQLRISEKLYGRSAEITTLLTAFDRVAAGSQELLLVTGHAGVGKSALVGEIHKPVTRERGYFIRGKFDQYRQSQPYAAFTQAFEQFADLLLSESEETLLQWRDKILAAANGNGAVLIEVMPGLTNIIGKQPPVPMLGGTENRNRFHLTFQEFVKAISTAGHPLVVFIDDWQWADLASLELLNVLHTGDKIAHLLMIGAYRDSEVDRVHPFKMALDGISRAGVALRTILLENLRPEDVHQLIQESLAASAAETQVLTDLVYRKTRGNAFFTRQFLHTLNEEGWLRFDLNSRRWVWDIAQLEAQNITDNVVDLMAGKLKKLPPETARLLQLAACIGNEFDLRTLVLIGRTNGPTALDLLSEALAEGLLVPMDSYYKIPEMAIQARFNFLHDRVQQAAYAQVPPLDRQIVHLEIGRLLLANTPETDLNQRVFSIVQHYMHSGPLITDPTERLTIAEMNMKAADLAYEAAAFPSAQEYLETALSLMPHDAWENRYDFMLRLHSQSATVFSLTGDLEQLERIFQITEIHAHTVAETAQAKQAKIRSLLYRGDYAGAIELGLNFIQAMGVPINRDPSPEEAFKYLQETAEWLTEARIENLIHLPEASTKVGVVLEIASLLNGPTYNSNMDLCFVLVSQITRYCIEEGLTPWAPVTLITFALLLSGALHDIPKARLLASITMQLLEKRYPWDNPISPLSLVRGGFIMHRHDHLGSTIPILIDGVQKGLRTGNFLFASYCAWWQTLHLLFAGAPLTEVETVTRQAAETCKKAQMGRLSVWCLMVRQTVLNLQGRSEVPWVLKGDAYDVQEALASAFQLNDLADAFRIISFKAWLNFLFGRWEQAVELFREAESYILNGVGHYLISIFYLYDTLANAALAGSQPADGTSEVLQRMNRNLAQFEVWVRFAPMNHQHKKDLMEAEKARLEGRYWEAATFYQKAIQGAGDNGFLNEEALACELCGKFWIERGNREIAQTYLGKARDLYSKWGAAAKAEQIETVFGQSLVQPQPHLRDVSYALEPAQPTAQAPFACWLDIGSLLKASRTLSQTVELADLLAKMIEILLENAGAERVLVLYRDEGGWFIRAGGQVQDPVIQTGLRSSVSEAINISSGIFNYVIHSGKAVVLENASRDPQFGSEPYLCKHEVKSVLCLPIRHKGELNLVLYLENNLTECAFTEDRLEFLQLLSGQMAISLENALIYDSLKTSIAERKRAEETLKESEGLLQAIIETARDSIFVKDSSLRYVQVNAAMESHFGKSREELLGHTDSELFGAEFAGNIEEVDRRVLEGEIIEERPSVLAHGKMRHFHTIKVPLFDADGRTKGVCGIARDVTEIRRAAEDRRQLQERLQRAEKMEALGTLAGGVAHDLNNVLGIVVGYSELLLDQLAESGSARSKAMEILKGGQRAAAIVQDLLTLARRGVSNTKVLDLNKIVLECRYSPEFTKISSYHANTRIETDLEPHLLNMSGSAVHLGKSLLNLVSNAAEAMPVGGLITIKTRNRYLDKPVSGYDEVREGDYVVLSVSDTGEGIPLGDLKRIFEPFYTKKIMGRSGTGLGLAVVWGTVKDHLGYINVESAEGRGTTFTLYFPVTREELSQEQISISVDKYMGNGESILVVDDVKEQRELAGTMLEKLDYTVVSVSGGEEAVEYLRQNTVDLVVLDMIMDPGMDGLDTYAKMLEIQPHQKAIIVSGFSETERVSKAMALGAGAYVKKPYILEALGLAVRKELDRPADINSSHEKMI